MSTPSPIRLSIAGPLAWPRVAVLLMLTLAPGARLSHAAQTPPQSQTTPSATPVVLDRAVAVVNKHVILASDLEDEMRLSVFDPNSQGQSQVTPQAALDQLISRALIEQQIREEDAEAIEPSPDEVEARLDELRKQLPACVHENCASDAGWKAFLASHGLTPQRVETYMRYRLEILSFIEQRFRQGVQITPQQIEAYYHDRLLPQYKPGEPVPPLDQVSQRIQEILLEQRVNDMFSTWLANLRQQGDIEVLDPTLASTDAQGSPARGEP